MILLRRTRGHAYKLVPYQFYIHPGCQTGGLSAPRRAEEKKIRFKGHAIKVESVFITRNSVHKILFPRLEI